MISSPSASMMQQRRRPVRRDCPEPTSADGLEALLADTGHGQLDTRCHELVVAAEVGADLLDKVADVVVNRTALRADQVKMLVRMG